MRPSLCLAVALVMWAPCAKADEPWPLLDGCHWAFPKLRDEWRKRCCWCPDNYCAKPLPEVRANATGCVDDYCPKALPVVTPIVRGCVDDYCPKTCPLFLGNLCEPWYSCGPCAPNPR